MMRFRAFAWSLGISAAATGLYLISLQVAAERGKLEATELRIALVRADMKRLNTELGTRASQRQLEQWNGEVLALSTPKANQFLSGHVQLASLDGGVLDRVAGAPALVAVSATAPARPAPPPVAAPAPAHPAPDLAANLRYATYTPDTAPAAAPTVRKVAFTTVAPVETAPTKPKVKELAPAPKTTMLRTGTLASLAKAARAEGGR